MGLYNFKQQFVPMILNGTKTHTIRGERKHPAKVGETLHLYTGLRQKGARLLMRVPCVKVENVSIEGGWETVSGDFFGDIKINNNSLISDERDLLAWRDGFRFNNPEGLLEPKTHVGCFDLMMEFWRGRLPFHGHIIHWDYNKREKAK